MPAIIPDAYCNRTNNGLERSFGGIGHDFCVNAITSLEQAEHDGFTASAAPAFATNSLGSKVGFIGFEFALKGRLGGAKLCHSITNTLVDGVRASERQPREFCGIGGSQVHGGGDVTVAGCSVVTQQEAARVRLKLKRGWRVLSSFNPTHKLHHHLLSTIINHRHLSSF